ncbi:MAG: magnesium transporter [Lachnospiraceae bacterium]|nr:magnesium transporter [Lachnospiraceae bacterium]
MENEKKDILLDENPDISEAELPAQPDYEGEILTAIRSDTSPRKLREFLDNYHENDIAEVMPELTANERRKLYRVLDTEMLSSIIEHLDEEDAGSCLNEMDLHRAAAVISETETDTALAVLRTIQKDKRALIIELMDSGSKRDLTMIASFDEDEIGSKMTTNCIILHRDISVKEAMSELVAQAGENDNISTLFVVDETGSFYGAIDLKELIIARQTTDLEELIMTSFPYVYGNEDIDECIEKLKDYSEDFIPVLDINNRILGVITSQNIVQIVDEEMGEDYARLAGLTAEEDLEEPLKMSLRKRMPWLIVLLGLGLVVSTVVGQYEEVVAELTIIMAFQSLILDMSGNVGTQSLAVTIRVLMDEHLTGGEKLRLFFKELRVGVCDGIIMGALSCVFVGVYIYMAKGKPIDFAFAVSGCLGISMLVAMIISSSMGTLIPMFFRKIHVDPAVASGPLITTTNDLIAVVTYYSICRLLLINIMHLTG